MATKKITVNELRNLVKQIMTESKSITKNTKSLKESKTSTTKKVTSNGLTSLVEQIIKEESEVNKIKKIEYATPGRFYFERSYIDMNPFRVFVTVDNYNGSGGKAELLYGINTKNNRDSFKYGNGGDYHADIIDIDSNFKKNLITSSKSVSEDLDNQIRDEIAKWVRNEIKIS